MELKFRLLNKDEIDVRLGTQKLQDPDNKRSRVVGASYLLYKDARVDMRLLDEVVGPLNWRRTHNFKDGKLYCTVSIWDDEKKQWVDKEDVGVESNTEAEKGQASDSFKRACFNFGIGRELYTSPFIWIKPLDDNEDLRYTKMKVKHIGYDENGRINELIIEDSKGNVRFEMYDREKKPEEKKTATKKTTKQEKITVEDVEIPLEKRDIPEEITSKYVKTRPDIIREAVGLGIQLDKLAIYFKHDSVEDITNEELMHAIEMKKKKKGNK